MMELVQTDMSKIKVSFITINYNSSKYTLELVDSIQKYSKISYEIIVIDNNSIQDDYINLVDSLSAFDNIKIIRNKINSGFASGNMLGVNFASGKYYFFINNDTKLLNNCADIMVHYLNENIEISVATAKVYDQNGNFSSSYKLFPSLPKELFGNSVARKISKKKFPSNKIKLNQPTLVEVISGSCMFFRATDFCEIGGFDTTFFLYCEEEDICKRIWDNGGKVAFLPDAKIFHESGGSTKQSISILKEYYISYKHLVFKHFNFFESFVLIFLQIFKLFRRSLTRKNGYKLFLFALFGFRKKESLKYSQVLNNENS